MHWPGVAPAVKRRSEFERVEACCDITYDPENKPERGPRRAKNHSHVFASKAKCAHAYPIAHPVDDKGTAAVGVGVIGGPDVASVRTVHGHLEGEGYEGVNQGEQEVGADGCGVAPYD